MVATPTRRPDVPRAHVRRRCCGDPRSHPAVRPATRTPRLVAAFLGVNVGVPAVAAALATSSVNARLGLGLFGVLSIIRLRSEELAQHEIAYYFAALALGLIGRPRCTSP